MTSAEVHALAQQYGAKFGVPPAILYGLVEAESGGNPAAEHVNANGSIDRGLVQINSAAHPEISDAQARNPHFAVAWAAVTLAQMHARYGSWTSALEAYNSGGANSWDLSYAQEVERTGNYVGTSQTSKTSATVQAAGPVSLLQTGPTTGSVGVVRWVLIGLAVVVGIVALLRIL